MRTTIIADILVTLDPRWQVHQPGYLIIEDGIIHALGALEDLPAAQRADAVWLKDKLVMPGLVNAHAHTPMVLFRGIAEGYSLFTFDGWYNSIRTIEYVADADMVAAAVEVSCAEMIRTGTTCFADQYFYMDKVLPVVKRSGMRATLCYGIVDEKDPAKTDRELALAEAFLKSAQGEPLIQSWLGPHALFEDNTVETIAKELPIAERYNAGFHIHMLTDTGEDDFCRKHFGMTAAAKMIEMGILRHPVLAAHCVQLQPADMALLANTPFTAVTCSSAAMRSGAGAANITAMLAQGVNVAIGTDNVANANAYDLFTEMNLTAKLASHREGKPGAVSAKQVIKMAISGGARGMGLDDRIGTLEPGKEADLIALDLNAIGWTPRAGQDVYTALVYAISGQSVTDVMVHGNWLLREGSWLTLDYRAACQALENDRQELQRRIQNNQN